MSEPALKARAQNTEDEPAVFIVRRPIAGSDTPWYLVAIMLFWSCVDFTSDRLLFNVLWTDWVFAWGPGSSRLILCPTLGASTKNIASVFRCSFPGIVQLGCSSFLKPTAPSAPVLDATGFRPRSSPNRLLFHPRRGRRIRRSRNERLVSWPPSCFANRWWKKQCAFGFGIS